MEENQELEWARRITEGLVGAQSRALANQFILMEVVRLLARPSDDPHRLLSSLFEQVGARLNRAPAEDEAKPVIAATRNAIAHFFAEAGQSLE